VSFINVVFDVKIYMLIMSHKGKASVKVPSIYETGSFIAMSTTVRHFSL